MARRPAARTAAASEPRPRAERRPVPLDLSVRIGPMRLANPVLTASGTYGYGDEYAHVQEPRRLGAVITKTVTLEPRSGNAPVRIAETAAGMLNTIGLENVGLARYRAEKLPALRGLGATAIVSIGGETPSELERLLETLGEEPHVAGFEINFSCPNVARGGARYWADTHRLESTLRLLRPLTRRALIAKLSPDVTSVGDCARACEAGGADAVTAVNTFVGMAVDADAGVSRLARLTGGLSGPAIKPLALARCHEASRAVSIPVLGSGGIMTGRDALEFIVVGAAAVQVGTASFLKPRAATQVLEELESLLRARGVTSLDALRGSLRDETRPRRRAPARNGGAVTTRRRIGAMTRRRATTLGKPRAASGAQ